MKLNLLMYIVCTVAIYSLLCVGSAAKASNLAVYNMSEITIVLKCTIETPANPPPHFYLCEGMCGSYPPTISSKDLTIEKESDDTIILESNQKITINVYYIPLGGDQETYLDQVTGKGDTNLTKEIDVPGGNGKVSFYIVNS